MSRGKNMSSYIYAALKLDRTKPKVKAWLLTKHQNSRLMNSEHDSHL